MYHGDYDDDARVTRGSVTQRELQYLSGHTSTNDEEFMSEKDQLVDRMSEQLLQATNVESDAILGQSLRLNPKQLQIPSKKEEEQSSELISTRLHESTRAIRSTLLTTSQRGSRAALLELMGDEEDKDKLRKPRYKLSPTKLQIIKLFTLTLFILSVLYLLLKWGTQLAGPPNLPVGSYRLLEAQVGPHFFDYYEFYSGKDSAGSNGYNMYVSKEVAEKEGIVQVVTEVVGEEDRVEIYENEGEQEVDWLLEDLEFLNELKRREEDARREKMEGVKAAEKKNGNSTDGGDDDGDTKKVSKKKSSNKNKNTIRHLPSTKMEAFNPDPISNSSTTNNNSSSAASPTETFVYLSSSPTKEGPRNSIRLEGKRRFNRGLFIIDLRHMPAGKFVLVFSCIETIHYEYLLIMVHDVCLQDVAPGQPSGSPMKPIGLSMERLILWKV